VVRRPFSYQKWARWELVTDVHHLLLLSTDSSARHTNNRGGGCSCSVRSFGWCGWARPLAVLLAVAAALYTRNVDLFYLVLLLNLVEQPRSLPPAETVHSF